MKYKKGVTKQAEQLGRSIPKKKILSVRHHAALQATIPPQLSSTAALLNSLPSPYLAINHQSQQRVTTTFSIANILQAARWHLREVHMIFRISYDKVTLAYISNFEIQRNPKNIIHFRNAQADADSAFPSPLNLSC